MRIPFLQNSSSKGRVGIEMGGNKLAIAHMTGDMLNSCYYDFVDDPDVRKEAIKNFVSEHQLKGLPCTLVLHPRCYQLLLTDMPDVEEDEIAEALPWKVKDLLHYPLEEVVLQHFLLPEDAFSRRQRMLYVAAVPSALLNQMADLIDDCELELDSIDVAELVLFGSVMQSREPQKNTAVLYLDNRQGMMCLGQQHAMYLSRSVDAGLDTLLPALKAGGDGIGLSAQQPQDAFLLEAQRSLDYYESQQGKGAVVELVCMPMAGAGVSMQNFLKDNLAPEVIPLEFNALFETEGPFQPAEEQHCLLAAMAAKRWQHHTRSAFQLGG